jgi:hypothetical protein
MFSTAMGGTKGVIGVIACKEKRERERKMSGGVESQIVKEANLCKKHTRDSHNHRNITCLIY